MNEVFEKVLMKEVRAALFAKWLIDMAELFNMPFSDYSRIHRHALCTHISEFVTVGLYYVKKQREVYLSCHNDDRVSLYTCIINSIEKFVDALTEDEYIYLFHLRNQACHIFAIAYDYIDINGNVKSKLETRITTKKGKEKLDIHVLEGRLKTTICKYGANDAVFMEYIYNKSKEIFTPMFMEIDRIGEHIKNKYE